MSRISYADALQSKAKPMFQIMDEIRELIRRSIERINKGLITPVIHDTLKLKDANKALKKIENREVIGRLILTP